MPKSKNSKTPGTQEFEVSDQFLGVCDMCGVKKRVCNYSDQDINLCDKCLCGDARFRMLEEYRKNCPKRTWQEQFPEIAERIKKADEKRNSESNRQK